MGIEEVAEIINKIAEGFEEACGDCLRSNSDIVIRAVTEQLYSGLDGEEEYLSPTYDNDDFFEEKGFWYHRGKDYKAWKYGITPPERSSMLDLAPRPESVPNLKINGAFYESIDAYRSGNSLILYSGRGDGPEIVQKYGDQILDMGPTAIRYFTEEILLPAIDSFFKDCGYR